MITQEEINELIDNGKMIYCFDLDDTLIFHATQRPNTLVCNHLRKKYKKGHYIIIHTARPDKMREATEKLLLLNRIPYHELIMNKPKAHIYIDDSTVDVYDYICDMDGFDKEYEDMGNVINKRVRTR